MKVVLLLFVVAPLMMTKVHLFSVSVTLSYMQTLVALQLINEWPDEVGTRASICVR